MGRILLEICCGSADDVIEAARGGADRVELNSSLFLGGLTPTAGMLRVLRQQTDIPVMAMVRPRAGGFCYTDAEFETAKEDTRVLLENGADGLVFGFLHEDGTVDEERTRALMEIAEGRPCVFHRAIDVVPDWKRALGQRIGLGVTRVLTSGQQSSALLALDTIREMIRYADGAITGATGCTQVHLSGHKAVSDPSVSGNPGIHFGGALYPPEDRFSLIDRDYISAVRGKLG